MSDVRWDDVLRVALLGTERAALPPVDSQRAEDGLDGLMAAAMGSRSAEHALLTAVGLLWLARRAGRGVPRRLCGGAPRMAPVESCPVQGLRASGALVRIANGASLLLNPWLEAAAGRGCVVHPAALCSLLQLGADSVEHRPHIAAVLGERGRWLAAQNPAWSWVSAYHDDGGDPEETWRLGLLDERAAVLSRLRANDPARARALLQTTWVKDGGNARAVFIDALAVGLSDDDEPFLEEALHDKRSTVRTAAARLLGRLPGSRLVARMTARLGPFLSLGVDPDPRLPAHLRGKETFFVALPKACDEAMVRDGMLPKVPHYRGPMGERSWWLQQMLAVVPPSHHGRRFRRSARAIVDAAAGNEHARVFLEGLRNATVLHGDTEMAAALVEAALEAGNQPGDGHVHPVLDVALLRLLPPAQRSVHAREALRPPLRDDHLALALVDACDFIWDDGLAQAFIRAIRASMRVPVGESEQVRRVLRDAVLRLPASCIGFAQMGWPLTDRVPAWSWVDAYNKFLESLRLREEAWAALDDVLSLETPPSA